MSLLPNLKNLVKEVEFVFEVDVGVMLEAEGQMQVDVAWLQKYSMLRCLEGGKEIQPWKNLMLVY
ncbi:hypothetical protein A2U01_0087840 [Trifolium medium]|uniref:Uncharacterized protein n=1 Tax=Trifolium medium TaxID=97028 RepID=A0A392TZJ0_9FABA|nr:hypothetical protein [Trifolium medium]